MADGDTEVHAESVLRLLKHKQSTKNREIVIVVELTGASKSLIENLSNVPFR